MTKRLKLKLIKRHISRDNILNIYFIVSTSRIQVAKKSKQHCCVYRQLCSVQLCSMLQSCLYKQQCCFDFAAGVGWARIVYFSYDTVGYVLIRSHCNATFCYCHRVSFVVCTVAPVYFDKQYKRG